MKYGLSRYLLLFGVLSAGQFWVLWSTRWSWFGHWPLTSAALVSAAYWPGVVVAAVGALIVVYPRIIGLEAYQLTSVHSERQLAWGSCWWVSVAVVAAGVCAAVGAVVATGRVGGFGSLRLSLIALAIAWPLFGVLAGAFTALLMPRRWRVLALLLAPLAMYLVLVGSAQITPGPLAVLSPSNVAVSVDRAEPSLTGLLRVVVCCAGSALLACLIWRPRLRWWAAGLVSVVLTVSIWTLPQASRPIPHAQDRACVQVQSTEVCWLAWGAAGSGVFTSTVGNLVARTPPALRPAMVIGESGTPGSPTTLAIGYPGGNALEAPWPSRTLIARSYVEHLVMQGCPQSPVNPLFVFRGYQAFGLNPNLRVRNWQPTENDMLGTAEPASAELMKRLNSMSDNDFFQIVLDRAENPNRCGANAQWWLNYLS